MQGRLVGQSISRAGKAEEAEKHLPDTFAELRTMLQDWAVDHGGPFLINGTNYVVCLHSYCPHTVCTPMMHKPGACALCTDKCIVCV